VRPGAQLPAVGLGVLERRYPRTSVRDPIVGVLAPCIAAKANEPTRCHQPARCGGRGIHWYQTDDEVLGYVPGAAGGYQVPVSAIPQLVRCTHTRPGTTLDRSLDELRMPHWS
jgi:hypothetical protein